jgi:4-hydroxy-2-oxoheptanedioate aldolase
VIETNFVANKIRSGRPVIGTWNTLASPLVTDVLSHSGFDFVIIDFEHGPFDLGSVHEYVARCERNTCSALVRVPTSADWMVLQAMDQGAHGIVMPHVDTKAQAAALVSSMRYHPKGQRGFTPFPRAGGFSNRRAREYAGRANTFGLAAVIIESLPALNRLDEIIAVDGVEVVYFGAYDLSQELGVPGEVRHPKVLDALRVGVEAVEKAGLCAGGFVAESTDDVKWLLDMGMRFITYDVDTAIISRVVERVTEWFKTETGE